MDVADELRGRCGLEGAGYRPIWRRSSIATIERRAGWSRPIYAQSPYAPCIPTRGTKVRSHSDWIHEVKQDGFRLIRLARWRPGPAVHPQRLRLDQPLSADR